MEPSNTLKTHTTYYSITVTVSCLAEGPALLERREGGRRRWIEAQLLEVVPETGPLKVSEEGWLYRIVSG